MSYLYITSDRIGGWQGGASVTWHEATALASLGHTTIWGRAELGDQQDPWGYDIEVMRRLQSTEFADELSKLRLAHLYAGCFSKTVSFLKSHGVVVSYTSAAHSIEESKAAHEELSGPGTFDYEHLTNPLLWDEYSRGYFNADCLVCPSQYSANILRSYGAKKRVEVIQHGVHLPKEIKPLPNGLICGYLGSCSPDKFIIGLLQVWKHLNYRDATLLIGGNHSTSDFVCEAIERQGGGNIQLLGFVPDVKDFYSRISLYVQPSRTESFGCEVTEAMSHSRPVICSTGAGACELLPEGWRYPPKDLNRLVAMIDAVKKLPYPELRQVGLANRAKAEGFTWPAIQARYVALWKELLNV